MTASDDKTVRLWDAATGNSIAIEEMIGRCIPLSFHQMVDISLSAAEGSLTIGMSRLAGQSKPFNNGIIRIQ